MFLRQLEYLVALASERHFGRAAAVCNVSQPALSTAIRKLERELGVELVRRGHRYDDLTPAGRALLPWAQRALAGVEGLEAEATRLAGDLAGRLRLGVIPTALPAVAAITGPLLDSHPALSLEVRALSSVEIAQQLEGHAIDAGVTYLDNEPLPAVEATPVYEERYLLVTADPPPGETVPWAALHGQSVCLLSPDMQNRRIVDAALAAAGAAAVARVETNSISALLAFARAGRPCVAAHAWLSLYGVPEGVRALALVDPVVTHSVGLVTPRTELVLPAVRALRESLGAAELPAPPPG